MYIKVTVFPGSKKEHIKKTGEQALEIAVKAKAAQNLANRAVTEKLAGFYNIPVSQIRLINGHRNRKKMFSIECEEDL